jgi:hypothetical protein
MTLEEMGDRMENAQPQNRTFAEAIEKEGNAPDAAASSFSRQFLVQRLDPMIAV